jgi:cytochrome c-type biogenesis protein
LALSGVAFIAGVSLIFILFFYAFSTVLGPARSIVVPVAGVIVILFALQVAGVLRIRLLMREFRLFERVPGQGGPLGGFLLGLSFAAGWTPCIGPTLGAVITSGLVQGASAGGVLLMIAYCLGLGLPFLAMALAFERATPLMRALNRRRRLIDLASAAVLLFMGALLLTNNLIWVTQQLARFLPGWLLAPLGL